MTKIEIIFNGERLYGLSEVLAYLDKQRECIFELERENAELKQLVEWLDMAIDSDIPIADKLAELEKENTELKKQLETVKEMCCGNGFCAYRSEISLSEVEKCLKE